METHLYTIAIDYCILIRKLSFTLLTCLRYSFILNQNCSFIFDTYSINLCLGSQLLIICHLIPLYFSKHLHRYSDTLLPNVWTLPSESCLPFCLVQENSYLCGQGGDVAIYNTESVLDNCCTGLVFYSLPCFLCGFIIF